MTETLYRFWRGDDLLYIGISINAYERASQHRRTATWWGEADRVTFEKHPNRAAVRRAEAAAIRAEKPRHNIHHAKATQAGASVVTTLPLGSRRLLRPTEVAERIGIALDTLYKWRSEGTDMPKGFTIGNRVRFYEDVVDAWIEKRSNAEAVAA